MELVRDGLMQLAETVWSSVLSAPTLESTRPTPPGTPMLIGSIAFRGAWPGRLDVRCTGTGARAVASAMLGTDADDLPESEVRDALGELANILGGNLKTLLPQPTLISLPSVSGTTATEVESAGTCLRLALGQHTVELALHGPR